MKNTIIGSLQKAIAGSRLGLTAAIKMREQCDTIIGLGLQSGIAPERNGEGWLVELLAPRSSYFVDVGGNIGAWSLLFADRMNSAPRGLVFEPAPGTVRKLQAAIAGAGYPGIEVLPCAAADVPGTGRFWAEAEYGETSSLVARHSAPRSMQVEVPITTLDIELEKRNVQHVDVLKIDAEGYDLRVLMGARNLLARQGAAVVQFEYNHPWAAAGSTLQSAFALLEGYGYKVRVLKSGGLYIVDPARVGEYYRYSNYVAYTDGPFADLIEASAQHRVL